MFRGLIVTLAGTFLALLAGRFGNGQQEPFETPGVLMTSSSSGFPFTQRVSPLPLPRLDPVPVWVRFGKQRSISAMQQARNRRFMATVNANNVKLDTVVYGDSITAFHQTDARAWDRHFGARDAHMGMGGSTVPELAWRIMKGGELPRHAPRNVVFLVGINDVRHGGYDPTPMLEELVRWCASALPGTAMYVHALLPTTKWDVKPANDRYRQMAARVGALFVECGGTLDPANRSLFGDGLHPTRQGHDHILACLKRELVN